MVMKKLSKEMKVPMSILVQTNSGPPLIHDNSCAHVLLTQKNSGPPLIHSFMTI